MENMNYYEEENKVSGSFINFKEIGESVEGTLIGRSEKNDNYNPGKMQKVYEIMKDEDGSIVLVGGRAVIDPQMKNIRIGQKIAIKFEGTKPSKKGNDIKLIQVYAPKDANGPLMNQEWIQGQAEANMSEESAISTSSEPKVVQNDEGAVVTEAEDGEIKVEMVDFETPPTETTATPNTTPPTATPNTTPPVETTATAEDIALMQIKSLAIAKLGATEDTAIQKTMEATGLAILTTNYNAIIEKLNSM